MEEVITVQLDRSGRATAPLLELIAYCREHPDQRFWQALTNLTGKQISLSDDRPVDPYGYEGIGEWRRI